MTKEKINKEIQKMEPNIAKNSDEFLAYQVLLSAAVVGPNQQAILRFLKTPKWPRVIEFIDRAKRNKVFVGDKINGEIYSDGVGLALGCNILLGYIRRVVVTE